MRGGCTDRADAVAHTRVPGVSSSKLSLMWSDQTALVKSSYLDALHDDCCRCGRTMPTDMQLEHHSPEFLKEPSGDALPLE